MKVRKVIPYTDPHTQKTSYGVWETQASKAGKIQRMPRLVASTTSKAKAEKLAANDE